MSPAEITARSVAELIEEDPAVAFAYLFGSVAKGSARPSSDVDVAVFFGDRADGLDGSDGFDRVEAAERALDLEGKLEARLERPVQVVSLHHASPELVQNVLGHGRLLFSRDERTRKRFYVQAGQRIYDRAHARAIFERYRERRIRDGTFGGRSRNG